MIVRSLVKYVILVLQSVSNAKEDSNYLRIEFASKRIPIKTTFIFFLQKSFPNFTNLIKSNL